MFKDVGMIAGMESVSVAEQEIILGGERKRRQRGGIGFR
jgi:hypothetical protein